MSLAGDDDHYDNTHRAFLQALLARQTITYDEAKPLLAAIQSAQTPDRPTLPEDVAQEDFEDYIYALNGAISPFDLEVRSTLHQTSRQRVYALVNTSSDALTQLATVHTADEIAFVKRVLDAMFETYNTPRAEVMAVTGMQALKLAKPPAHDDDRRRDSGDHHQQQQPQASAAANAGLTMSQAEKVLQHMEAEGWFDLSPRGFYSLSPRALMELRSWLVDAYNGPSASEDDEDEDEEEEEHTKIKFCQACKDIVTVGQRCPDLACNARLHNHCVRNIFRAQGNREECPQCKTAWVDPPPVGEKAAKHSARRSTNGMSSRARRRTTNGVGMDGARDDEETESESE